ncbi:MULTISPECIES: YicC/YloC family endoribonuclease [unclassified Ectothiorhodospira]|uniref:YicC/YloC family endoribonuclease n=1 Tax=unclassified Ectothiorhodospira TaxID=2684909 RepID=UPI001EE8908A|nr:MULTISPECIES: YicC/YloC family endoribonuclease [unclassified Ectothiorhodospira]MCG5515316.1 YicC family protein [Ectothiorhodospira sp. 9100]MCG5519403.1 YicC family protein [Ectothiorhodospira sp. 9905]
MSYSMTGFARCESSGEFGSLVWELRSVNHRYLEISPRLPEELRGLEGKVRERIQSRVGRGKVECNLRFRRGAAAQDTIELNDELAKEVISTVVRVEHWMMNAARMTAMDILRWPGVVVEPEQDLQPVMTAALELLDEALNTLVENRGREGAHIKELLQARCKALAEQVARVRARRPQVVEALRERVRSRIQELGTDLEPGRLEQELALQAQKLDVAEELDRLDGHVKEIHAVLARREPVGRRLDFLMQELNREANTLSSKSNDMETTQAAVELKVLIEQMREQIQNLE